MKSTAEIQTALAALGYDIGTVDGVTGPRLKRALATFQQSVGLTPDGVYGPRTEAALFPPDGVVEMPTPAPVAQEMEGISLSLDCITRNIWRQSLGQGQIDGCMAITSEFRRRGLQDKRYLAYMLATAFHETGKTMQPVKERGGTQYFTKMYDVQGNRPDLARKMGNVNPGDGAKYCGRGYVQLTWRSNYETMTRKLREAGYDYDLVNNPDLAMRQEIASFIMFEGMLNGTFTGRNLRAYFNGPTEDWVNARKIINGLDCAQAIAAYGRAFNACLG